MSTTTARAEKTERGCPVCGEYTSELLFLQTFRGLDRIGLLDGYDVVACQRCGMTYADHIPSQAAFDEYYRELSKYAYEYRVGKESPDDQWRLRQIATGLHSFIPNLETRILEIGCSNGRLLAFLKDDGYANIFGLDPSPSCADSARTCYGLEVFTGSIFDSVIEDKNYEFIILIGVLEHIREVGSAVTRLRQLAAEDGLVYVEVPDPTHFVAERDAPFQEFSTEHLSFFSPTTLQYLMEAGGFRTIKSESTALTDVAGRPVPINHGVFQKANSKRTDFPRHYDAENGLRRYIRECREMDSALRARISDALKQNPKFIVWGVGTHTQRLLATGALDSANIAAFVDSNPKYQNQELKGIPVVRPDALKGRSEPIMISSFAFQQEIAAQIRTMGLPNQLILLYSKEPDRGC